MIAGHIILLNGTLSSGKSTLARALREALPTPFCYYASDQLADAGFRSNTPEIRDVGSPSERDMFFDGFHRSIAAFAVAGNNLIVEHIVEQQSWWAQLQEILAGFDTFWVGVHAPLPEIERRERTRGDRSIGEAAYHLKTHEFCRYDHEVDTTQLQAAVVSSVVASWISRTSPRSPTG